MTVDMASAGWLVLADQNYPGWTAKVDGQDTPVYTADYLLRAVTLGVGRHEVVFQYVPTTFWPSLAVSVTALVALIAMLAYTGFRWYSARKARKETTQ